MQLDLAALQQVTAEQQRCHRRHHGQKQPGTDEVPAGYATDPANLVETPGRVPERKCGTRHEATDKATARLVVAREKEIQRQHHRRGKHHPNQRLQHHRAPHGEPPASIPAWGPPRSGSSSEGSGCASVSEPVGDRVEDSLLP